MINKELLSTTLELIEQNYQHWRQAEWHCGTTHCFAGFVVMQLLELSVKDECPNHESLNTKLIAQEALGLEKYSASALFCATNTIKDLRHYVDLLINDQDTFDLNTLTVSEKVLIMSKDLAFAMLQELSIDQSVHVRTALTEAKQTPRQILETLAQSPNPTVASAAQLRLMQDQYCRPIIGSEPVPERQSVRVW
jgi:hypothetical protein